MVKNSWGYHNDDGYFFDCSETEEPDKTKKLYETEKPYGPRFETGDTIGCCLNFRNNTVFYTKNGMNIAITDNDIDDQLKEKWIKALKQCDNEDKDMIEDFIKPLDNTFALAKAYFIMGKYDKSLKRLTELIENEPDNAFALRYRGETYLILNKYEESNADLKKLLEINKDDKWASQASNEVNRR